MEIRGSIMSEPVIIFEQVSKHFPLYHHITGGFKNFLFHLPKTLRSLRNSRFQALKNISFEVRDGETFGIIGNNGTGKSTTLGMIAGVIRPSFGTVKVKRRVAPLLELGAGFHHELSGRENIVLNGVLLGMSRKTMLAKMDDIIEFSELNQFIDQPIRAYSSGMLARLGFSIVVHLDPEIMLIDEVLGVGDINFQKKCADKMLSFRNSGVTTVLVSHSIGDVQRLCDRVMWIEDHQIKMIGPSEEVTSAYLGKSAAVLQGV
jgi:lipopolysaccharide transport system ATP-binding protein